MMNFVIEQRAQGRTLVVTGPWTADAAQALARGEADGLELNYAKGFGQQSLAFLDTWPIRRVLLIARSLSDLEPLTRLADTLEDLSLQAAPRARLDMGRFPHLASLATDWRAIRQTISNGRTVRRLMAFHYFDSNLSPLTKNQSLTELILKDAPGLRSLAGLSGNVELSHLGVLRAHLLSDISAVTNVAPTLCHFELQDCSRIESFESIWELRSLTFLGIADCATISSIVGLRNLRNLEVLHAWGNTRVADGDLSSLQDIPRLREVRMRDRREYRPRLAEIPAALV